MDRVLTLCTRVLQGCVLAWLFAGPQIEPANAANGVSIRECPCPVCDSTDAALIEGPWLSDGLLRWTAFFEIETAGYLVETADDPASDQWISLGDIISAGAREYGFPINAPIGAYVRLVEVQTSGRQEVLGFIQNVPPRDIPRLRERPTLERLYQMSDSLLAERTRAEGDSVVLRTGTPLIIYASTAFLAALNNIVSYWNASGYSCVVEPIEQFWTGGPFDIDVRDGIDDDILAKSASGVDHFLLVGNANDWRYFDGPETPALWTGSWETVRQGYLASGYQAGGQPLHDVIPTWCIPDPGNPYSTESYGYPYFLTDDPYADTNGDDVPDVVVTRWPAQDHWDVVAMGVKAMLYNGAQEYTGLTGGVSHIWSQDHPKPGSPGAHVYARAIADQLRGMVSGSATFSWPYIAFGDNVTCTGIWNNHDADFHVFLGIHSGRYAPANFFSRATIPPIEATMLDGPPAVVVSGTCYGSDWAHTERAILGHGVAKELILDPYAGAIAWVGPSAGSYSQHNASIMQRFMERLLESASRPVAESWMLARQDLRNTMFIDMRTRKTASSYTFLGDPVGRINSWGIATASPAGNGIEVPGDHLTMAAPRPNPGLGRVMFEVDLSKRAVCEVKIFDVTGRLVRLVARKVFEAGRVAVEWDGEGDRGEHARSGIYFAHVETDFGKAAVRKFAWIAKK